MTPQPTTHPQSSTFQQSTTLLQRPADLHGFNAHADLQVERATASLTLEVSQRVVQTSSQEAGASSRRELHLMARRRERLERFELDFDSLAGLICAAAHMGVREEQVRQYADVRDRLVAQYRPLRRYIARYFGDAVSDPFRSVLSLTGIHEAIGSLDCIPSMTRARAALNACRSQVSG